ncbi:hypothetical protein L1887_43298 [Cichorium endivia]|nr:hypothetical protein L1887_43298 [Cichorium endivia]
MEPCVRDALARLCLKIQEINRHFCRPRLPRHIRPPVLVCLPPSPPLLASSSALGTDPSHRKIRRSAIKHVNRLASPFPHGTLESLTSIHPLRHTTAASASASASAIPAMSALWTKARSAQARRAKPEGQIRGQDRRRAPHLHLQLWPRSTFWLRRAAVKCTRLQPQPHTHARTHAQLESSARDWQLLPSACRAPFSVHFR